MPSNKHFKACPEIIMWCVLSEDDHMLKDPYTQCNTGP